MNRIDLLKIVVGRARSNGFEFRRWYTLRLGLPWISSTAAISLLDSQRRYYALLFSHDFAAAFWKAGEDITFAVPAQSFQRQMPDGTTQTRRLEASVGDITADARELGPALNKAANDVARAVADWVD